MLGKSWAIICLSLFLIIFGLAILLHLSFEGITVVEGLLAVVAGILFLLGK
jgi:hypothetical protein